MSASRCSSIKHRVLDVTLKAYFAVELTSFTYFLLFVSYIFFSPFAPTLEHMADFSVTWSFTDGRTLWTGDQLVARPPPKHRTTQTEKNAHTHQISMPWVGFEPTIPASERAKTLHSSDRSATETGRVIHRYCKFRPLIQQWNLA
jgi:hypothetical protein